jgi:hypothetical protein
LSLAYLVTILLSLLPIFCIEYNGLVSSVDYREAAIGAGYTVFTLEARDHGSLLTAEACAAMRQVPGVSAIVWLRQARPFNAWAPNGPSITTWLAGGDVSLLLESTSSRLLAANAPAQAFADRQSGVARGRAGSFNLLAYRGSARSELLVAPASLLPLGGGLESSMIVLSLLTGSVDSCDILIDERSRERTRSVIERQFPPTSGITRDWAMLNADRFESPEARFHSRPGLYLWIVASLIDSGVWVLMLRVRRAEISVYRLIGLRPNKISTILGAEFLSLSTAALLIFGIIGLLVGGFHQGVDLSLLVLASRASARMWLLTAFVGLVASQTAVRLFSENLMLSLKDR